MQRYEITGMSCAACASHVEKAVAAVPGVASVAVSLLTNSMQVDYAPDADPDATAKRIINAVDAAGYGASLATAESENAELEDTETPRLKKRLIASLCFLVPLMYVSMGHMIGLPLPPFMEGHGSGALVFGLVQLAPTLMPPPGASSAPWTPPGTARPSPPPRAKAPSSRTPRLPSSKSG